MIEFARAWLSFETVKVIGFVETAQMRLESATDLAHGADRHERFLVRESLRASKDPQNLRHDHVGELLHALHQLRRAGHDDAAEQRLEREFVVGLRLHVERELQLVAEERHELTDEGLHRVVGVDHKHVRHLVRRDAQVRLLAVRSIGAGDEHLERELVHLDRAEHAPRGSVAAVQRDAVHRKARLMRDLRGLL